MANTISGILRIKAKQAQSENSVLVTDGDFPYEMTEKEYVRGCYKPALEDLPWKA